MSRPKPVKTMAFTTVHTSSNSPSMKSGTCTPTGSNPRRARGGTPSARHSHSHSPAPVSVTFETVMRIRPLLKKEREDFIILEKLIQPIAHQQQQQQQQHQQLPHGSTSVVLHPLPKRQEPELILSPSAALVSQNYSPEAPASANNHNNSSNIQTAHDLEYQLDHALSADANQEKVYYSLGLPVALSVMEPLRRVPSVTATSCTSASSTGGASSTATVNAVAVTVPKKKTHLMIGMGVAGSGKTFTCWGGGPISKRATPTDGLIPRFVDSLFSQSQHNLTKRKTETFGVNLSILQVNQSIASTSKSGRGGANKHGKKTDPNECTMHDLLQPINAKRSVSAAVSASSSSLSLNFVRAVSATAHASQKYTSSGSQSGNESGSGHCGDGGGASSSHYNSLDEPVSVEQDEDSPDFYTVNAQVRTCKSAEQAREALQTAYQNSRKLSHTKKYQSHVLVKLQPVLLDSRGRMVQSGGMVAVLDMAGADVGAQNSMNTRASKRSKDAIPSSGDAHAALFHVLRTLQHNQHAGSSGSGGGGALRPTTLADDSSLAYDSSVSTDTNSNIDKPSFGRQVSLKKVPYRQHQLTMLLQSLFSPKLTDQTVVTLLLAASPGHRDYLEKKILLTDLETFRTAPPTLAAVTTGASRLSSSSASSLPRSKNIKSVKRERKQVVQQVTASDADDEGSIDRARPPRINGNTNRATVVTARSLSSTVPPVVCSVLSMTYSDDEDGADEEFIPLPPPVAPTHLESPQHSSGYNNFLSPAKSVPPELIHAISKRELEVMDFPGVVIPTSSSSNTVSPKKMSPIKVQIISSAPPEHQALPLRSASSSNSTGKFSPMKTINKVVSASKKKGMKVIDKMTTMDSRPPVPGSNNNYYSGSSSGSSSSNNKTCIPRDYSSPKDVPVVDKDMQARSKKLEASSDKLRRENVQLRDKNEELVREKQELRSKLSTIEDLVRENQELRSKLSQNEDLVRENQELRSRLSTIDRQGASNYKHSSSMQADEPRVVQATIPHRNATQSRESSSSEQDENRWEPPPRRPQENMMDNPLFQHMAQLSGQRQSSQKDEERVQDNQDVRSERSKNDHQGGNNHKYSSSMQVDENKAPSAVQAAHPYKNVTRSLESSSSEQDENRQEAPPRRKQENMMDNPLFQHMAQLSGKHQANSPWNQSSSTESVPSSSHQGLSLHVPSGFGRSQY
jgi:hypothetical protein